MIIEPLIRRDEIALRIAELAKTISKDYQGRELVVIGVLKGAFIFMGDLIRRLQPPCIIDFIRLASYGGGHSTGGKVIITKDIETSLAGKDVLIVEDIVDSGTTMAFLRRWLGERNPHSLRVCTLLDKPSRRLLPLEVDYVGFCIDDVFVVGYGLDCAEKYRYLSDICILRTITEEVAG